MGKRRNGEDLGASHRQRTDFTRQRRYPIVTANAGNPFVTGARDGHSESAKFAPDSAHVDLYEYHPYSFLYIVSAIMIPHCITNIPASSSSRLAVPNDISHCDPVNPSKRRPSCIMRQVSLNQGRTHGCLENGCEHHRYCF